jgi:hypothetical protein
MKNTERSVEKRSHDRLQTDDVVYAIINYKPTIFGQIINISKEGIAVHYSSNGQLLSTSSELDIFILNSHFHIEKIQIKIISDFEIGDKSPFISQNIRQRCFQFGKMKSYQLFQLGYLLKNFTIERRSGKDRRQLDT